MGERAVMIQPQDIRLKAEVLYREFTQAWLRGHDGFFPTTIRGRKTPRTSDLAAASQAIRVLRESSKEVVGFGFSVEWREVNSRTFGRNQFPARILFETSDDLLRFLGRKQEFETFTTAATRLRSEFPVLEEWIRRNTRTLLEIAPVLDRLLIVLNWFCENPRPNLFARELPLPVDTKFIERHQSILREWFDLALPYSAVRSDEEHFFRRYGLLYAEPHFLLRFLDPELQMEMGFPCGVFSLPLTTLSQLCGQIGTVFIVENKTNLLTLPSFHRAIALGGLGNGVTILRYLPWLQNTPIIYWGDIDVEGFAILSTLRALFPHAESFLMEHAILEQYEHFAVAGTGRTIEVPPHLNDAEKTVFLHCREGNLRLEQEHVLQSEVLSQMTMLRNKREQTVTV
jgi:hypothetical protein